jgi:hypothetical protein
MPLCYKLSPELNMILYVGRGYASPSDFFALEEAAFREQPRPRGMITLVDALELHTAFDLHDIHQFIDNIASMAKNRTEPGPYIMLTRDWGLHLLVDAAQLMAGSLDLKARTYYTLEEAVVALGLADHRREILDLWEECKLEASEVSSEKRIKISEPAAYNTNRCYWTGSR